MSERNPYHPVGTLLEGSYIPRHADEELKRSILENSLYPYLLAPRQSGKSSLLARTKAKLSSSDLKIAIVDLSEFEPRSLIDYEEFVKEFILQIIYDINGQKELINSVSNLKGTTRFFLESARRIMSFISGQLVICVDEVDKLRQHEYKDAFFAHVRSLFNRRVREESFKRLQFILAGTASPEELITDLRQSPFNVGKNVPLDDLSLKGVTKLLMLGWPVLSPEVAEGADKLLHWTSGSAFLCQEILHEVYQKKVYEKTKFSLLDAIDHKAEEIIQNSPKKSHFINIERNLLADEAMLKKWCNWVKGKTPDEKSINKLSIIGVCGENKPFRNLIYQKAFSSLAHSILSSKKPRGWEHAIANQLAEEKAKKKNQKRKNLDTTEIDARILTLKRKLRDGPPLKEGLHLGPDGRFELWERAGSGGFATVWKAYDHWEEKPVAVKVLHGQHVANQSRKDRFRRGARKMKALEHPGIVRVVEPWGEDEGYCYYAMEWMPGGDMQRAALEGKLPPEQVISMIMTVGEALQFAHERRVVHRDVKPSNILLDGQDGAKLTDFDLVQAHDTTGGTRTGALGTVIYAAPEALEDAKNVKPAMDVYGLAMSCIFGLYGQQLTLAVYKHAETVIEKLPCNAQVKAVLAQGVEWDLGKRYPSARMFSDKLASAQKLSKPTIPKAPAKMRVEALAADELGWSKTAMPVADKSAVAMVREYEAKGREWPLNKRMEWLEKLGALGDPRLDPRQEARWVAIEPGDFLMGGESKRRGDEPQHKVVITQGYWLGRYPVTNAEFTRFIEAGGYRERGYWSEIGWQWREKNKESEPRLWRNPQWNRPNQPVVGVNWHEAEAYCRWLEKALQATRPEWAPSKLKVELPGEAQWEYAARGIKSRAYAWAMDEDPNEKLANYGKNIGQTTPVGMYPRGATPEGLLDMAGNVWEWQRDEWQEENKSCKDGDKDPAAEGNPSRRPLRGGSWGVVDAFLRASFSYRRDLMSRSVNVGFRCSLRSSSQRD